MAEKTQRKVVGYVRCSTIEQGEEGLSLEVQENRIKAYCTAKEWNLVRIYRDKGQSGSNLDRPGLQTLIEELTNDGIDAVVILKLDRLTRSVRDLGTLIDDFFQGIALTSVEESLDSQSASGLMVMRMLSVVSQWERETISERTSSALRYKQSIGEYVGRVPYGFQVGEDGKLIELPEEMAIIRKIKRDRSKGKSIRWIAAKYNVPKSIVGRMVNTDLRVIRNRAA